MKTLAQLAIAIVALSHLIFAFLEIFLWRRPVGRRIFGLTPEFADASASLAANQGLYNAFLAAGLVWGLVPGPNQFGIQIFFLSCVILAGIFGAVTVKRSILWVQALPAMIALALAVIS